MITVEYKSSDGFGELRKKLPFRDTGCVTALGFFDGVHIAHRALISVAKKEARELGLPLVIFTFSGKGEDFKSNTGRIYTDEEKCELLAECGADYTLLCDFSALSSLSKESFVKDFLVNTMGAKTAVCGFNFRFGRGASGNASDLDFLMRNLGGRCIKIDEFLHTGVLVSSTRIRALIEKKDTRGAAALLGKPYFITGKVSHGLGIGSSMGLPTVNTELQADRFSPPRGVYATVAVIDGRKYCAITNIGTCPTFGERDMHAETFILGFDGDVYERQIKIHFIDYLREEKTFSSKKELIMQIDIDKTRAKSLIEELKWQEIGLN